MSQPEVWVIKFEDADVADDVFIGEGAEEGSIAHLRESQSKLELLPTRATRAHRPIRG